MTQSRLRVPAPAAVKSPRAVCRQTVKTGQGPDGALIAAASAYMAEVATSTLDPTRMPPLQTHMGGPRRGLTGVEKRLVDVFPGHSLCDGHVTRSGELERYSAKGRRASSRKFWTPC